MFSFFSFIFGAIFCYLIQYFFKWIHQKITYNSPPIPPSIPGIKEESPKILKLNEENDSHLIKPMEETANILSPFSDSISTTRPYKRVSKLSTIADYPETDFSTKSILNKEKIENQTEDKSNSDLSQNGSPKKEDELSSKRLSGTKSLSDKFNKFFFEGDIRKAMMDKKNGIPLQNRWYAFQMYSNCFTGTEAIEWIIQNYNFTRSEAINTLTKFWASALFHHVSEDKPFRDSSTHLYQFSDIHLNKLWVPADGLSNVSGYVRIKLGGEWVIRWVSLNTKDEMFLIGEHETTDWERLVEEMSDPNNGVIIKNRRHRFKVYKKCFLGSEAVQWLMNNKKAKTIEESIDILRGIMEEGLMEHVLLDHLPKNEKLFYRFVQPVPLKNLNQFAQYLSGLYLSKSKLVVSQEGKFILFEYSNMPSPLLNIPDGSKKLKQKKIEKEYSIIRMKIPAVCNVKIRSWIFALYDVIGSDIIVKENLDKIQIQEKETDYEIDTSDIDTFELTVLNTPDDSNNTKFSDTTQPVTLSASDQSDNNLSEKKNSDIEKENLPNFGDDEPPTPVFENEIEEKIGVMIKHLESLNCPGISPSRPEAYKFLISKNFELERAIPTATAYVEVWQKFGEVKISKIAPILRTGMVISPPNRFSKSNEQIVYLFPRNVDFSKDSPEDRVGSILFFMQRDLPRIETQEHGFMLIIDMAGAGLNPNFPSQRAMISVFQQAVPAKARKILILNINWVFNVVFSAVKNLLSPKLQERIQILPSPEKIFNYVSKENLLSTVGGTLEFDHNKYIDELLEKEQ